MVECPGCPKQADVSIHAAVEITRWVEAGTETLYRCPRCGWEETRPKAPGEPTEQSRADQQKRLAS